MDTATTLVSCKQSQVFGGSCIESAASRKVIFNPVVTKLALPRSTFEFCSKRIAILHGSLTRKNLRAVPVFKHKRLLHTQAMSRKDGKPDNSGDRAPRFGPLFANGSAGVDSPVPSEQQPVNEYQSLVDSVLFSWAVGDVWAYGLRLSAIGAAVTVLLGWPVVALSVNPEEEFVKCAVGALCGGLLAVTLAALRMYLGWAYVGNRLFSATVEYEETGWYDGEVWVKPPEVLARDRLLGSYKVKPALNRVKLTLIFLAASLATCSLFFIAIEGMQAGTSALVENTDDSFGQFYGGAYSDASARKFEHEAFESESEPLLPDYCF